MNVVRVGKSPICFPFSNSWILLSSSTHKFRIDVVSYEVPHTINKILNSVQRSEDLAVTNIGVKIDEILKESNGTIDVMMPNYKDFIFVIKRDLIDSITDKPTATSETQTASGNF